MTIESEASYAWREFINQLEEVNADVYKNLWMKAPADDPKVISEDFQQWRFLVQGAFLQGYFRGKEKMITGE
jgi:hypothetical protein